MEVGKSFSYVFEDEKWTTKMLLGILVTMVPILNFAWIGYYTQVLRNVSQGVARPLPDWDDFGDKFVKGLILFLAGLIYALPAVILGSVIFPVLLLPAFSGDANMQETFTAMAGGSTILVACCVSLYALALSFYMPAVNIHFARIGTFGSCFQLSEIFKLVSQNIGNYLLAWLMTIVFGIVVGLIISVVSAVIGWVPCIGWAIAWLVAGFGGVWSSSIYAHLFGQVGAQQAA
jgi:hypothetical protein